MDKIKERLYVLGAAPILLNVLLELCEESGGFTNFQILSNLPEPVSLKGYQPLPEWAVQFKDKGTYEHDFFGKSSCCLGVVGAYSKPLVYEYFRAMGFDRENYVNLIHPTAYISRSVKLENGLQLESNSTIAARTQVGFGVNITRQARIGHHVRIGDYVTVNPGVTICGEVDLGDQSIIGPGVTILCGKKIGANSVIGAGSVVTKDIPEGVIAYGNPCKVIRDNIQSSS